MNSQKQPIWNPTLTIVSLAGLLIGGIPLLGQSAISGYAQPNLIKTVQLIPPSQSVTFPFWVDQTSSFSMTVSSLIKNLSIQLIDPNGSPYVFGQPPGGNFSCTMYPDPQSVPDAPGAHYYMSVETPVRGQWSLAITAPSALQSNATIPIQLNFNNQVAPVIFGGGGTSTLGRNVSFGLAVLDGTNKVANIQINAALLRLDDPTVPPVPVTFTDDGLGADYAAGDSIYSVYFSPTLAGDYMFQVEVSGDASTGHFQRSIASGFKVVPRTARIVGTFKERVIPVNPR